MFLIECFEKENNTRTKHFHIHGTDKDIAIRQAKERLQIKGVKCRVKHEKDFSIIIPNHSSTTIKIREV